MVFEGLSELHFLKQCDDLQETAILSPTQVSEPMTPSDDFSQRANERFDPNEVLPSSRGPPYESFVGTSVLGDEPLKAPYCATFLIQHLEKMEELKVGAKKISPFWQKLHRHSEESFLDGEYDHYFQYYHKTSLARHCLATLHHMQQYFTMAKIHPHCHVDLNDRRAFVCSTPGCVHAAVVPNVKSPATSLQHRLVEFQANSETILPMRCYRCWTGVVNDKE